MNLLSRKGLFILVVMREGLKFLGEFTRIVLAFTGFYVKFRNAGKTRGTVERMRVGKRESSDPIR